MMMKITMRRLGGVGTVAGAVGCILLAGCAMFADASGGQTPGGPSGVPQYTIEQSISDQAQGMTIAFDGLAFLTGSLGADSFFPPGKVADFWGFQYLRDNDPSQMGHNTDFLTKASLNMLNALSTSQRAQLITLAKGQVDQINEYGYDRFVLMKAFRRLLEGDVPAGSTGLSEDAVKAYSSDLYRLDGEITYARAVVMGGILHDLSASQKSTLDAMVGQGMLEWPTAVEPSELRGLTRDEKVAVMTYAGDLFSWYAGSVDADVYFCPERHGTYFGSFYMKDAPAVGNPNYSISTTLTGDSGQEFLSVLDASQEHVVTDLVGAQRPYLLQILDVRRSVSAELRQSIAGGDMDKEMVLSLMGTYGELDGAIVYQLATAFAEVGQSLTSAQTAQLAQMRAEILGSYSPTGAFLYSEAIPMPTIPSTDFLFATP